MWRLLKRSKHSLHNPTTATITTTWGRETNAHWDWDHINRYIRLLLQTQTRANTFTQIQHELKWRFNLNWFCTQCHIKYIRLIVTTNNGQTSTNARCWWRILGKQHQTNVVACAHSWNWTSLVPVTYAKDENRDQYLKGELEIWLHTMVSRDNKAWTHRNQNKALGLKSHCDSSVYLNI